MHPGDRVPARVATTALDNLNPLETAMKTITRGTMIKLPTRRWSSTHSGDVSRYHTTGSSHAPDATIYRRLGKAVWALTIYGDAPIKVDVVDYDHAKKLAESILFCRDAGLTVTEETR